MKRAQPLNFQQEIAAMICHYVTLHVERPLKRLRAHETLIQRSDLRCKVCKVPYCIGHLALRCSACSKHVGCSGDFCETDGYISCQGECGIVCNQCVKHCDNRCACQLCPRCSKRCVVCDKLGCSKTIRGKVCNACLKLELKLNEEGSQ
jgi:hypothetical protein